MSAKTYAYYRKTWEIMTPRFVYKLLGDNDMIKIGDEWSFSEELGWNTERANYNMTLAQYRLYRQKFSDIKYRRKIPYKIGMKLSKDMPELS